MEDSDHEEEPGMEGANGACALKRVRRRTAVFSFCSFGWDQIFVQKKTFVLKMTKIPAEKACLLLAGRGGCPFLWEHALSVLSDRSCVDRIQGAGQSQL